MRERPGLRLWLLIAAALTVQACAARTPPPAPTTLRYPEFVYPRVPPVLSASPDSERVDFGWRFLQTDDLRNAEREFSAALRRSPNLYPAQAGAGYVELARRDYGEALAEFDTALKAAPQYAPALVGRGQALLALQRDDEALRAFEAALAADDSLSDVRRRVSVLRFRNVQEVITSARQAAAAGRVAEARDAYARALEVSPDSAFLHRELGMVERRGGQTASALEHFRQAVALDPSDADSFVQIGELLEAQGDYTGAEEAYRAAAAVAPDPAVEARIERAEAGAREARLPPEFREIGGAPHVTRGDLAALIAVRLEPLLEDAQPRQVVITDVRAHWAAPWITQVARAGVMEPFANHTFQPGAGLRRMDLAAAVSRLVRLAMADRPDLLEQWTTATPAIADIGPGHLSYPDVALAVASGVMPLLDGGRFDVARPVTGTEAVDTLDRLRAIARDAR